ncbi:hypothetical protein HDU99_005532, partial [Rhizoclosmatium hyalinum]
MPTYSATATVPVPQQQPSKSTTQSNLRITDIRPSNSFATSTNLAPLIAASLTTKNTVFPASSAVFDKSQNAKTSPYHATSHPLPFENQQIRSIPTLVLYDDIGLDIYDAITYVPEYYLTNAELGIFEESAGEIIGACVEDGGVLVELGCGSMRKVKHLLDAIVAQNKSVTYYALDLSGSSLTSCLTPLAEAYPSIQFVGLLGTYDDSLVYMREKIPRGKSQTLLWLGSSIGNYTREEAAQFLVKVKDLVMET